MVLILVRWTSSLERETRHVGAERSRGASVAEPAPPGVAPRRLEARRDGTWLTRPTVCDLGKTDHPRRLLESLRGGSETVVARMTSWLGASAEVSCRVWAAMVARRRCKVSGNVAT
jgi:hypothetical protein